MVSKKNISAGSPFTCCQQGYQNKKLNWEVLLLLGYNQLKIAFHGCGRMGWRLGSWIKPRYPKGTFMLT